MLIIRLARIGRKNDPAFRVVVTEHTRGPKSGKHLEILGNYNPKMDDVSIDGERVKYYISNGAQVSDTVHNILVGQGIIEGKKINVLPKKSPIIKEEEEIKEETKEETTETSETEVAGDEKQETADSNAEDKKDETPTKEVDDSSQGIASTDVTQETTDPETSSKGPEAADTPTVAEDKKEA